MQVREFRREDTEPTIELWRRCDLLRPWNDPRKDILRKLEVQSELFLVGEHERRIIASVMAGYDGHRGYLNYVAVDPDYQRKRYGKQIVEAAEQLLVAAGAPKVNLNVRTTNTQVIAFYHSLGYSVDDVVGLGKRFINDESREHC
jgi:ribosomal protein S18 acetylase RimI-like enzyme